MTGLEHDRLDKRGWGSGLSTAELAAVRRCGFEPAGLVMGSSVYSIATMLGTYYSPNFWSSTPGFSEVYPCPHGYSFGPGFGGHQAGLNWEQTYYEQGIEEAYSLAHGRLVAEARDLQAHGVVGARLRFHRLNSQEFQSSGQVVEFTVIGTAVRCPGAAVLDTPFTSHLSGQGLAKLMSTGVVPAALVLAAGVVQVMPGCEANWSKTSLSNVELRQYSEALEQCRAIGVKRLDALSNDFGDGVIGVDTELALRDSSVAEMMLIGTAVRRFSDVPLPAAPMAVMKLRDR